MGVLITPFDQKRNSRICHLGANAFDWLLERLKMQSLLLAIALLAQGARMPPLPCSRSTVRNSRAILLAEKAGSEGGSETPRPPEGEAGGGSSLDWDEVRARPPRCRTEPRRSARSRPRAHLRIESACLSLPARTADLVRLRTASRSRFTHRRFSPPIGRRSQLRARRSGESLTRRVAPLRTGGLKGARLTRCRSSPARAPRARSTRLARPCRRPASSCATAGFGSRCW